MVSLDDARVQQMIDVAWKESVPRGKEIITEGDLVADFFYIVQEGTFEVYVCNEQDNRDELVQTVNQGGSFGELALLYLVPRAATVKAKQDSVVWVIDRGNFKGTLMKVSEQKIDEYVTYL